MSKIAIVNIGMHGHVNPTLGFTAELVNRGHEVLYLCDEAFHATVAKTGVRQFGDYGSLFGKEAAQQAQAQLRGEKPWADSKGGWGDRFTAELKATYPGLLKALKAFAPDVLVYNFLSCASLILADQLAIPAVKFFTTYASNESYDLFAMMRAKAAAESTEASVDESLAAFATAASELAGRTYTSTDLLNHPEAHNLVFMPKSFQPASATFDQRFHFVGPCLRQGAAAGDATDLIPPGTEPLVLISMGTVFTGWTQFYHDCVKAFTGQPWRVCLATGPHVALASLGTLPANIVARPHLPQLPILAQAAVFISHGGMNSTMESLAYGVPLISIPQMEEQEMTARQVSALNLGKFLPKAEVTADTLLAAVQTVHADAQIQANVEALQAEVLQAGGSARAADVIVSAAQAAPLGSSLARDLTAISSPASR